jgi:hypothetical protein
MDRMNRWRSESAKIQARSRRRSKVWPIPLFPFGAMKMPALQHERKSSPLGGIRPSSLSATSVHRIVSNG